MLLESLRLEIIDTARAMSREGLVRSTWGNISARDSVSGLFAITPSGMDYFQLLPEDVVVMDPDGRVVDGRRKPSIETPMHRLIMRNRPDVSVVIHTHSVYATAFACLRRDLPVICTELAAMASTTVRTAEFATAGTEEFGLRALEALEGASAALLANHGAVSVGSSLKKTFDLALVVEEAAKMYFIASSIGTPVSVPFEEAEKLHRFYVTHYGQAG